MHIAQHATIRPLRNHAGWCLLITTAGLLAVTRVFAASPVDETAHTKTAVEAVDAHWMQAEISGDTAWLDAMLLPGYRSISADGSVLTKAVLLKHAAKNRGSDAMRKKVDAWRKAHPSEQSVVMHGNVAVLSFHDPGHGPDGTVYSSDIFVYEDSHWHALYSQHSAWNKK